MEEQYNDIKNLVKDAGVNSPSSDFMKNVMDKVELISNEKPVLYQPLISNKAWLMLSLSLVGFIVMLTFLPDGNTSILEKVDFSFLRFETLENPFSNFSLHKTTFYGILFLAVLFMVQITFLKRRLDKVFSL